MSKLSIQEIEHHLTFCQSFNFESKFVVVFDLESQRKITNAIDSLILRMFSGNIHEIPISGKEKESIQELLYLKESLKKKEIKTLE
jgi:hypothetical protein